MLYCLKLHLLIRKCRRGSVTEIGNVLKPQYLSHQKCITRYTYKTDYYYFFPKETFNQLISQFVSELLIDMAEDNSYSSYQKLSPLAGILPKTPTQRAVCRHDVFYSFSLPCLFYFQARLLESQHTFLNLINPSVLALPIKFLPF